ncbi:MAG: hypothetical protein AAGF55_00990 [Pseudomonadota bacterium]
MNLYFVSLDLNGENYDLFVTAGNTTQARAIWSRFFTLPSDMEQYTTVFEAPEKAEHPTAHSWIRLPTEKGARGAA